MAVKSDIRFHFLKMRALAPPPPPPPPSSPSEATSTSAPSSGLKEEQQQQLVESSFSTPPTCMRLSQDQRRAWNLVFAAEGEPRNVFISGEGGTGKSELIRHIVRTCAQRAVAVQVCALTGCAAILLKIPNTRTIHSWSGIKTAKGTKEAVVLDALKNRKCVAAWRKVKVLIIDEVSMMSQKVFEILEELARRARRNSLAFGGIQVVMSGDFYQLPPVSSSSSSSGGGSSSSSNEDANFCFESDRWSAVFPSKSQHVILTSVFRQSDPVFKSLLSQVRRGFIDEENAALLASRVGSGCDLARVHGAYRPCADNDEESVGDDEESVESPPVPPPKLFALRAKVELINRQMFAKLSSPVLACFQTTQHANCTTYLDEKSDKFGSPVETKFVAAAALLSETEKKYLLAHLIASYQLPEQLQLKKGAVVMCTMNLDLENGVCNGSQGQVVDLLCNTHSKTYSAAVVRFASGFTKTIYPQYVHADEFPTLAIGFVPLCLSWAVTIHKMQGVTLSAAEMDLGSSVFECGQTYVALSRVKSLEGLFLSSFDKTKIRANAKVAAFYHALETSSSSESTESERALASRNGEPEPDI